MTNDAKLLKSSLCHCVGTSSALREDQNIFSVILFFGRIVQRMIIDHVNDDLILKHVLGAQIPRFTLTQERCVV